MNLYNSLKNNLKEAEVSNIVSELYNDFKDSPKATERKIWDLIDHDTFYIIQDGNVWWFEKVNSNKSIPNYCYDYLRKYIKKYYGLDYLYDVAPVGKNIKESEVEVTDEIKPIDHFIERGSVHIPVRKGETDEEVLKHLEKLGNTFAVEPTEEEKASGKYIQELVYSNPMKSGGLCWFEWVKNPDYVEPTEEVKESEENKKFILSINGKNPVEYNPKDMKLEDAKKDYLDNEGYGYNEEDIEVSYTEPAEEVKEAEVKLNADGVREDATDILVDGYKKSLQKSFDNIHTLQELSYILRKSSEEIDMRLYDEKDTNIQAMDVVKAFEKKQYKTMKDYQEALNDISAMEWDNKISREAYEEYVARLQKAYNERKYR